MAATNTRRARKSADTSNTPKNTSDDAGKPDDATPDATPAPESETLEQKVARLEAENEELRKRPERKQRERKMTPTQAKAQQFYRDHPEATPEEAFVAAGATASSHGLLWRMVTAGYLKVSAPVEPESTEDDKAEKAES